MVSLKILQHSKKLNIVSISGSSISLRAVQFLVHSICDEKHNFLRVVRELLSVLRLDVPIYHRGDNLLTWKALSQANLHQRHFPGLHCDHDSCLRLYNAYSLEMDPKCATTNGTSGLQLATCHSPHGFLQSFGLLVQRELYCRVLDRKNETQILQTKNF